MCAKPAAQKKCPKCGMDVKDGLCSGCKMPPDKCQCKPKKG